VNSHIILLGFMGSGKTTVGRLLAERLGRSFVDLDDRIEAAAGKTISEIFATDGEDAFRDAEAQALATLLGAGRDPDAVRSGACAPDADRPDPDGQDVSAPHVIALGGGAFAQQRNRDAIAGARAITIFLEAPLDTLRERCAGFTHRPLAHDPAGFAQLYAARLPHYQRAAQVVSTGTGTPEDAVLAIMSSCIS
jgi:shikimate kinase